MAERRLDSFIPYRFLVEVSTLRVNTCMNAINLVCENCKTSFEKDIKQYKSTLKQNPNKKFYCSKECQWNSQCRRTIVNCSNCDISFSKVQSQLKSKNHFCSSSCSAIFNNKIYRKKEHFNKCVKCGEKTDKSRARYCNLCSKNESLIPRLEKTIAEMENPTQRTRYSPIRLHARHITKKLSQVCKKCSYDKHVETCHIKGVSTFSKDTKMDIVNSLDNLVLLCPNCHWELDHGLLTI